MLLRLGRNDSVNGLLVRVGADRSAGGGSWNGPVDRASGEFVYVAIPENSPVYPGIEKPYSMLTPMLARFGVRLPPHLQMRHMHLDPDFEHLTYGDQGERARQLRANLSAGDVAGEPTSDVRHGVCHRGRWCGVLGDRERLKQ